MFSPAGPERICKNMLYSIVGIDYHKNRAVSTKSFENTSLSAVCKKKAMKTLAKERGLDDASPLVGHNCAIIAPNICMNADRLSLDLRRANGLPLIDADVECVWIFSGHPPERILDDDRGVVANTQFQKEDALPLVAAQKFAVPVGSSVPTTSSTKVSSARRFMLMGLPQCGQWGTSSDGI